MPPSPIRACHPFGRSSVPHTMSWPRRTWRGDSRAEESAPHLNTGVIAMNQLFRFSNAVKRDRAVSAWMNEHSGELGTLARHWFEVIRDCGDDVRELLHDGCPTACVADAAFAYVNAFNDHVNVGFFRGAELSDPNGLLKGTGKCIRHVKLRPDRQVDATALVTLINAAYTDIKWRLEHDSARSSRMRSSRTSGGAYVEE